MVGFGARKPSRCGDPGGVVEAEWSIQAEWLIQAPYLHNSQLVCQSTMWYLLIGFFDRVSSPSASPSAGLFVLNALKVRPLKDGMLK